MTEIRIRKGEPLARALRRLKKRLDRENVIKTPATIVITKSQACANAAK